MHQSGHSRAHSMQTVQFSSSNAITPRERGGRSGSTSGYCWVPARFVIVFNVIARPLASPIPGTPSMGPILPGGRCEREPVPAGVACLSDDFADRLGRSAARRLDHRRPRPPAGARPAAGARGRRGAARPRTRSGAPEGRRDRKSTRLNSSHPSISYAVFCLKKKKNQQPVKLLKKKKKKTNEK